jgi:nucleoside-diphosphate-sugar epimerase
MKNLVTGAARFIGNFVAQGLYQQGNDVVGLDNHKGSQINVSDPIDLI